MSNIFPNDALSAIGIRAAPGSSPIVPTSTTPFTVLWYSLNSNAQNLQQLQCYDGANYKTLAQVIGTTPAEYWAPRVFPAGSTCYLKTYDGSLTAGTITWVPYDLTQASTTNPSSTAAAFTNGELVETTFLFIIIALAVGLIAFIAARKRS